MHNYNVWVYLVNGLFIAPPDILATLNELLESCYRLNAKTNNLNWLIHKYLHFKNMCRFKYSFDEPILFLRQIDKILECLGTLVTRPVTEQRYVVKLTISILSHKQNTVDTAKYVIV